MRPWRPERHALIALVLACVAGIGAGGVAALRFPWHLRPPGHAVAYGLAIVLCGVVIGTVVLMIYAGTFTRWRQRREFRSQRHWRNRRNRY